MTAPRRRKGHESRRARGDGRETARSGGLDGGPIGGGKPPMLPVQTASEIADRACNGGVAGEVRASGALIARLRRWQPVHHLLTAGR